MNESTDFEMEDQSSADWWAWEEKVIVTENAESEVWQRLSSFTYEPNINRYWTERRLVCAEPKAVTEYIVGCLRQAHAYYVAAAAVPLDIKPLLYYYGTTTLLAGVSALLSARQPQIKGHGMRPHNYLAPARIVDVEVIPSDSPEGALAHFTSCFSPGSHLDRTSPWNLLEILGSIPDIKTDFEMCYPGSPLFCHHADSVRVKGIAVERLRRNDLRQAHGDEASALSLIHRVDELYISQWTDEFLVLYPKVGVREPARRAGWTGLDGLKYLQFAHRKGRVLVVPHLLIFYLMALFPLGFLSRYRPEFWNSFVQRDATGERLVVERFLSVAARNVPNYTLDFISGFRTRLVAPSAPIGISTITPQEVDERIAAEVKKQVDALRQQGSIDT